MRNDGDACPDGPSLSASHPSSRSHGRAGSPCRLCPSWVTTFPLQSNRQLAGPACCGAVVESRSAGRRASPGASLKGVWALRTGDGARLFGDDACSGEGGRFSSTRAAFGRVASETGIGATSSISRPLCEPSQDEGGRVEGSCSLRRRVSRGTKLQTSGRLSISSPRALDPQPHLQARQEWQKGTPAIQLEEDAVGAAVAAEADEEVEVPHLHRADGTDNRNSRNRAQFQLVRTLLRLPQRGACWPGSQTDRSACKRWRTGSVSKLKAQIRQTKRLLARVQSFEPFASPPMIPLLTLTTVRRRI